MFSLFSKVFFLKKTAKEVSERLGLENPHVARPGGSLEYPPSLT